MRSSASMLSIAAALVVAAGCSSTVSGHAAFGGPSPTPPHTSTSPTGSPSSSSSDSTPTDTGTATVGTLEFAQNLNPYSPNGDYGATYDILPSVLPSVFTLTGSNRYLRNADLLTADPTVSRSHGHMVVTYSLSPNAKWSDGTPIGVDDFNIIVKQAKQQKDTFVGPNYTSVTSVEKGSDEHHVVVTFAKSDGDWRSLFSPLLPAHYLSRAGWESGFRNKMPVTGGPFTVSGVTSSQVTLSKDPNYFGTKAHLDKIVFKAMPDPTAAAVAVNSGLIDAYYSDPTGTLPTSNATTVDGGYYTQLTFNLKKKPLNNLKVRQAIAYALGRDRIAVVASPSPAHPSLMAANNIFAAGSHGGMRNDAPYLRQNPVQAMQLLRQAGYGPSKPLRLTLVTSNTDSRRIMAAELMTTELHTVGIHLTVDKVPYNELINTKLPHGQFEMALFGWSYDSTAAGASGLFGCHGSENFSGYCNANFNRLVTQALDQPDLDKHDQLLNKADHQVWKDLPQIPLYQSKAYVAISPKLHGVTYDLGEFTLYWDTAGWTKSP